MRRFRWKIEFVVLWLPLLVVWLGAMIAGHSINRPSQLPVWLAPFAFVAGLVLTLGGVVGLFEPSTLEHWFRPDAKRTLRGGSQHLLAVVFGAGMAVWAVMALVAWWPW